MQLWCNLSALSLRLLQGRDARLASAHGAPDIFPRKNDESHSAADFSLHPLRERDWCTCHENIGGMVGS